MFRAVRFPRAVKELSGNFTCEVLDAQGGDVATDESELSFDTSAKDHLELYIYGTFLDFETFSISQRIKIVFLIQIRNYELHLSTRKTQY